MTLIRKWVLVLCLAWLPLNYSSAQDLVPGQVYTTNNIVQQTQQGGPSTWVNGVYQSSLTCWGGGDPGYCGPNAIVRPGNNINFSYGTTNLYQLQAIASVLPNTGSGLLVNGYNFGFTAKNGNGWDDGRVDYLTAYVSFYNPNGSVAFNKNYDLNYKFNWTTFNYSETFTTPFASKDLGSVQYGFVGRDNNFWAGPYGPEVNNVSFSLKYSIDPCVSNPLYAPTCPGYLEAFNKLKPVAAQQETTQTTTAKEPVAEQTIAVVTTVPTTNNTVAASTSTTPQVSTSTTQQRSSSAPSISNILSIITGVQTQVSGVERSVIQQAVQEAIKAGEKATQEAEAISSTQNQQQQESQQSQQHLQSTSVQQTFLNSTRQEFFLQPGSINQRNNTGLPSTAANNQESFSQNLPQPVTIKNTAPQVSTATLSLPSLAEIPQTQPQASSIYSLVPQQPVTQTQTQQTSGYSLVAPTQILLEPQSSTSVQPTSLSTLIATKLDPLPEVNIEQKQVIGPTNLLQPFLEQKPLIENVSQSQQTKSVNQSAQDSELAGQISLANIARQPLGFQTYLAVLQDVPFYKPTEVYSNQKTVDNQRAMRLLSGASDARHKELVDSQYRR
jgi:hypothetical protein